MKTKGNIWMLSELFYPDETSTGYILTEIAESLALSHQVNVITGQTSYSNKQVDLVRNISENICIDRVAIRKWDKNKLLSRVVRMLLLTAKISWKVMIRVKPGDRVIMVTNPAPLLLLVSSIAKFKQVSLTVIVHDVFPENMVAAELLQQKSLAYKMLLKIFNSAYRKASRLIVLGRDMQSILMKKTQFDSDKIVVIPNWADIENIFPVSSQPQEGVKIQFAGNLGRVQGIIPFLTAYHKANNNYLSVDFFGDGALKEEIERFITTNDLNKVRLLPAFRRLEQQDILNKCDIGLVSLAEGMLGLGVPSKSYNLMAAGKPILYIGSKESEIAQLIAEEDIGWIFEDFETKLFEFLSNLDASFKMEIIKKGERAREVAVRRFSKHAILKRMQEVILI
ncbi:MAG: glycosyltransferase family 4 protein [Daejeonella sp.]